MGPQARARIALRSRGRQALAVEALHHPMCEELLDDVTAMNWGPIPNDRQAAGHFAQQML